MTLPAQLLGGFSGIIVDTHGYPVFFVYSACVGVPGIILATWMLRQTGKKSPLTA